MEKVKVLPITKPGKEDPTDPSNYRPMSLINVGGKVLEKLLINRIMHHVYTNDLLNNQFGFTPKKVQRTRPWQSRSLQKSD